ncbi:MAG: nitroreductase family protein [Kiritimatiellae bacterium]|jgi:nitroreductase|nr:nitroreductase family protein [Kiritimatiellia bacterium]
MNTLEAINRRASYRGSFTDKKVSDETLKTIVQAGIQAPSGCNAQTTGFVIVNEPEKIKKIATICQKDFVAGAQAIIVCVVDHTPAFQDMSFAAEDCAAAVENMLLAITDAGLATVWLDGVLRRDNIARQIGNLLNIPADRDVFIILPVGEPSETPVQREKCSFEQRASFNQWEKQK